MVQGHARLFSIIGDPIGHVRTPLVFNAHFERIGFDGVCVPMHVRPPDLAAAMAGLRALSNLAGFIVTAPHKAAALAFCDRFEGDAESVGAVNTIRREDDGSFTGTMLDGRGFVVGLEAEGHAVAGRRIYIAGAGGAGSALAFALAAAGAGAITIANRTRGRAEALLGRLAAAYPALELALGTRDPSGHDIAVNATPLGLEPGDPFAFEVALARPPTLVAEVLMKPETTALLVRAAAQGCPVHLGRHMLDGQRDLMMRFFGVPADPA